MPSLLRYVSKPLYVDSASLFFLFLSSPHSLTFALAHVIGSFYSSFFSLKFIRQLMAAPRSVYSWDIYIQKFDGKVSKRHQVLSISDFSPWPTHCRSLRDLHSCAHAHTHTRTHTGVSGQARRRESGLPHRVGDCSRAPHCLGGRRGLQSPREVGGSLARVVWITSLCVHN